MTTNTNQPTNTVENPEDHTIIEITSTANSLVHNLMDLAIKNAPPHIKAIVYIKGNVGGILQIGIAVSGDQDDGNSAVKESVEFIGGVLGTIGGGALANTALFTGTIIGGSLIFKGIAITAVGFGIGYTADLLYGFLVDAKTQAEQDAIINTPDWIDEAINSELENSAVNGEIAKLKNDEYYTKLQDYQAQLKAIIEQDLPPEELAALQQEINLFKSAYTDKASSYQQWHEDYTNYQDFKAEYDNWQQEDTTWRAEYEALTSQTQLAESEKDTAQQNYDTWNTEFQEWHADYVQREEGYIAAVESHNTYAANYQSWLANAQSIVNNNNDWISNTYIPKQDAYNNWVNNGISPINGYRHHNKIYSMKSNGDVYHDYTIYGGINGRANQLNDIVDSFNNAVFWYNKGYFGSNASTSGIEFANPFSWVHYTDSTYLRHKDSYSSSEWFKAGQGLQSLNVRISDAIANFNSEVNGTKTWFKPYQDELSAKQAESQSWADESVTRAAQMDARTAELSAHSDEIVALRHEKAERQAQGNELLAELTSKQAAYDALLTQKNAYDVELADKDALSADMTAEWAQWLERAGDYAHSTWEEQFDTWNEYFRTSRTSVTSDNVISPIVIDLDGDGAEITALEDSTTSIDVDEDGYKESTAWVGADDAILAIDLAEDGSAGADGQITSLDEFAFSRYTENGTDLDGLRTFDSNNDGVLDASDERFNEFRLWQDRNSNGLAEAGELTPLLEAGIISIELTSDNEPTTLDDGSVIHGRGVVHNADGTSAEFADSSFAYDDKGYKAEQVEGGYRLIAENEEGTYDSYFHTSDTSANIDLANDNYNMAVGSSHDDTLDASGADYDVLLSGAAGDDTLTGGSGNDTLNGGSGSDIMYGGSGDDSIIIDDDDTISSATINGGEGIDKLIINGITQRTINLADINIESVTLSDAASTIIGSDDLTDYFIEGGAGDDVLTTAGGKDTVYGGAGNDTINTNAGNDYVDGGDGDDIINTGDGDDTIYGGNGNDVINAGGGDDTIYLEGDEDIITGGKGADTFVMDSNNQDENTGITNLIKDFTIGEDTIDLSNIKTIRSIDDISISLVTHDGVSYTKIDIGNNKNPIYLEGVDATLLTKESFNFHNYKVINLGDVALTTDEDTTLIITTEELLQNTIDFDGDTLSIQNLSVVGNNATLTANDDSTWTLTPNADFNGEIELSYAVSDGFETTTATATVAINNTNDAPVISEPVHLLGTEDISMVINASQLLANASDIDGDTLSIQNLSVVGNNATLTANDDSTWTLTPNADFNGEIELSYAVSDGFETTTATATVAINNTNDAPVISEPVHLLGTEDISMVINASQLLANASDIDGDTLSIQNLSVVGNNATLTANDDSTWTLTPNADFNGEIELSYAVSDGFETTTATATVAINNTNDAPVISEPVHLLGTEDISMVINASQLLANASDIDGDTLSIQNLSVVGNNATLTANDDSTWTLTPNADFNGEIELSYAVSDGFETTTATATVAINNTNDAPVISEPVHLLGTEDISMVINASQLLANASDIDGDTLSIQNLSVVGNNATLTANDDSTWTLTPNADFNGEIELSYAVSDGFETTTATATVAINNTNDAPVISEPVHLLGTEDISMVINASQLLANASDIDGDTLSIQNLSVVGNNATLTANDDSTWTLTPNADFNGEIELSYAVSDGFETTTATATVAINNTNDAPVISEPVHLLGTEDISMVINASQLLANASDIDGDTLSIQNLSVVGNNATLTANDDSTWTLTPNADFNGEIELSYAVSDGFETTTATATVAINNTNDAPVISEPVHLLGTEDISMVINASQLLANASDIDGDTLSIQNLSVVGNNATLTANDDSTWTLTPNADFNGEIELSYAVSDGFETTTATATVAINNTNDAPVISEPVHLLGTEDISMVINASQLLANASDIDGDTLSIQNLSVVGNNATLTANDDSTWTLTPNADFNGEIELSYAVSDGFETTDAKANITIEAVANTTIKNSNFEAGTQHFQTDYQILAQARGHDTLAVVDTPPNWGLGDTTGVGGSGKFLMVDGSTQGVNKSFWKQTVAVDTNQDYTFSYWVNANKGVEIALYIDGEQVGTTHKATSQGGWEQVIITLPADAVVGTTHKLFELKSLGTATGGNDFGIDDIILEENTITSQVGVIKNSNFEAGTQHFQTDYQILAQARGHDTLAVVDTPPNWGLGDTTGVGGSGKFLMVDGSTQGVNKSFWKQTVAVDTNQDYTFSYWVNANKGVEIALYIDGEQVGTTHKATSQGGWEQVIITLPADAVVGTTHKLFELKSLGTATGGNDFGIDDIILEENTITSQVGVIKNSNFEAGTQHFQTDYQILAQARGHDTLAVVDTPPNWGLGDTTGVGGSGKFLMVDGSTQGVNKSFWKQTVAVDTNQDYTFSYWVNANKGVEIALYIDGEQVGTTHKATSQGGWEQVIITLPADAVVGTTHKLFELKSLGTATGGNDFGIDDIKLSNLITGDELDNVLIGTTHDDIIIGNLGNDTLTGGLGSDTFAYNTIADGNDTITDFNLNENDKLDISALLDYNEGDDLSEYISAVTQNSDTIINIDANNDGTSDISITLANTHITMQDLIDNDSLVVL